MITMEQELQEQIEATKTENTELKAKLEITQSVLDEIMLGGAI